MSDQKVDHVVKCLESRHVTAESAYCSGHVQCALSDKWLNGSKTTLVKLVCKGVLINFCWTHWSH